ncbi:hypothetical protein FQA39_LY05195 [Lamprigera yunnana]|nr:hypothetical protein FQA39_LY05195 [Lamprigera yunnana]
MSDYDSEEEFYNKRKWFDVQLPDDFNPSKQPTTGEEYLHHVMYEYKQCKKVVSAERNFPKFKKTVVPFESFMKDNNFIAAPKTLTPSAEWQEKMIKEFTEYKEYVLTKLSATPNQQNHDYSIYSEIMNTEYPEFNVICDFDCRDQSLIMETINSKLENIGPGLSVDKLLGCWIYNILATIQKPLNPDLCVLLRQLSRVCSKIRSKLPPDALTNLYVPLNLFICIIGKYFGQLDLTD